MSENMTSMSSEQVDVLVNNTDNIWVVDAAIETSIEDTSQNDNIKNNDQGSLTIKPFSNIEHNRDNIKNNDQETDSTQPSSNTKNNRDNIKSNNQETVSTQPSSNTEHNRDIIKSNDQETVSTQSSSNTEHKRDNIKRKNQETVSTQPSSNTEHNRDNIKSNDQETVSTRPSSNTEHNRDDRKSNDQETDSTQPSSNKEQNGEELLVASGTDGCLEVMSREDNDEQLNADNDCRMFDIQKCSSLNAEPIAETCEEKVLLNLGPEFTEMYEQTVLLQPCKYHIGIMDGPNCQDASETCNSSNADSAFLLPDFTRLYDDDETGSVLDCEPISCDSDNVTPSSSSQIPYFEKCIAPDGDLIPFDCVPEAVTSSALEEKSLIELMKEIREDLTDVGERNNPETDLGLERLNEDNNTNCNSFPTKTKSAKKRKKQQLKLKKFSAPNIPSPRRQKFAQTFDELKRSYVDFGDYNLDSSITCPVCLDLYHLPSICQPCGHMFCDLCLRRLTGLGTEGIPCPLCRAVISSCELNREFDENLLLNYPDIYTARAMSERHSKYRHQLLPYTPPVPLRKRLMCKLIASRNQQSDMRWMSHDSFKFLLGCTVGLFIASLVMLYSRVTSVNDARDVNIVFLSVLLGATVTYLVFKYVKI